MECLTVNSFPRHRVATETGGKREGGGMVDHRFRLCCPWPGLKRGSQGKQLQEETGGVGGGG